MFKGKTESGFSFEIAESKIRDMRVVDYIVDVEDGKIESVSRLVRVVLTKEQKDELYAHCTLEDGSVSPDKVSKEIFEIIQLCGNEGKNS